MARSADSDRGLVDALVDDGRPLIKLTGLALIGSGLFAFFLAATGNFLPHDIAFLGMNADDLHSIADGRLVHFMMHDRVSFGGAILAVGTLYFVVGGVSLALAAAVGVGDFTHQRHRGICQLSGVSRPRLSRYVARRCHTRAVTHVHWRVNQVT